MKYLLFFLLMPMTIINKPTKTIYQFSAKDIDGKTIDFSSYKGKVLLIVNVASKCGYTSQYSDLQDLYETYSKKGFEIIGFPANNFLWQEPGSDSEIKSFCTTKYQVTFPMFSKISVKGKDIHPIYSFLTQKKENGIIDAKVKWNFQKFLINKEGQLIKVFEPGLNPLDEEIKSSIEKLL